jgi:hypothetical protein
LSHLGLRPVDTRLAAAALIAASPEGRNRLS